MTAKFVTAVSPHLRDGVNRRTHNGITPLWLALHHGLPQTARALHVAGADPFYVSHNGASVHAQADILGDPNLLDDLGLPRHCIDLHGGFAKRNLTDEERAFMRRVADSGTITYDLGMGEYHSGGMVMDSFTQFPECYGGCAGSMPQHMTLMLAGIDVELVNTGSHCADAWFKQARADALKAEFPRVFPEAGTAPLAT